ncbi:threonine/homoserine efflux transporter RhtA [Mariniflexile fucanivorans]|uniref:Threonine/homoserine efflux transporter RhtA n=1 Tax=Mariniflexile fucanivorans TaxID=264023 RepID=A0A4R1RG28_9FLAO|nr:DMT family transporter [Mariniflexile fucanivorans]TCL64911.1 threonine/homoserine efflux transporter RhtA [Mariniflexile fucanivorans]
MDVKNAIKFMIISALAFAIMNIIVKHLDNVNSYQIVFFRSLGSLFFTFGYLIKNKIPFIGNKNKLLILRSIVGAGSMLFFFISLKYLSVGTAVSLRYIAPIFAAIFAVFILKEKIKPFQWLFFIVSFIGVLVLKGLDSQIDTLGLIFVLIAAVLSGLVYIMINQIGQTEHPVVVVNYFMITAMVLGGVLSIGNWVTPTGMEWPLLFSLGVFGYFGQIYMTKAFQTASTNIIAPLKYVEVVFSMLLGVALFNEIYTFWSILGIILIITGLVLNVWYKARLKQ